MASLEDTGANPHAELIHSLDEFYSLLAAQGTIESSGIYRSDPSTGRHGAINTHNAIAAGFDPEAIHVMDSIPYITKKQHETDIELLPNTFPVAYLKADMSVGTFRDSREMLRDELMPPTALKLTRYEVFGYVLIYDCASSKSFCLFCLFSLT